MPIEVDSLILRPFEESDAADAAALIGRAMDADEQAFAERTFREYFASRRHGIDDGRSLFVLADEGRIVGITGLHQYVWGPPRNVWLSWFAVDPEAHGKGLGSRLMASTVKLARSRGFEQLYIETYSSPTFERARRFYEAKGFSRVAEVPDYLDLGVAMVVYAVRL